MEEESVILEERIDENYEPNEEEIQEYALFLGLDLPEDEDLLYIAREGLKAPLPKSWKPCKTREDEIYYFNFETGESQWEHPCDIFYMKKAAQAKAAKKKKPGSSKPPTDFKNKPLLKGPLSRIAEFESGGSEFENRKFQLENNFKEECSQIKQNYEEEKLRTKQELDSQLETQKNQIQTEHEKQLKKLKEEFNQKKELKIPQEQPLNDLKNIEKECQLKLEEKENQLDQKKTQQKDQLLKHLTKSQEEEIKIEKEKLEAELEYARSEYQHELQKTQREETAIEEVKERFQKKLNRLKSEVSNELEIQKKKLQQEHLNIAESIKNSQADKHTLEERLQLEKEESFLKEKLNSEIQRLHNYWENKLQTEKDQQLTESVSKKYQLKHQKHQELKDFITSQEKQLSEKIETEIQEYKIHKESETQQLIQALRERTEAGQSSEHQEERTSFFSKELEIIQKELSEKQTELKYLNEVKQNLIGEIQQLRRETVSYTEQSQEKDIPDFKNQTAYNQRDLGDFESDSRLDKLEAELRQLKKIVFREGNSKDWRSAIQIERQELKEMQKNLERDRAKWRYEIQMYKHSPSESKRKELSYVKKIIEKQIQKHNERVRELKLAEQYMKSKDPELEAPERKPTRWASRVRQPWEQHNSNLYQRELSKISRQREFAKDVMSRHGTWLNHMRDELSRASRTPMRPSSIGNHYYY